MGQGERHEAGGQRPREQVLVRVLTNQRSAPRPPPITAHLDPAARHAEAGQGEVAQHPAGEVRDGGREVAQLQRGHAPRPRPGGEAAPQPRQPVSVDVVARQGEAGRDHAALSRGNIFRVSEIFSHFAVNLAPGDLAGPRTQMAEAGAGADGVGGVKPDYNHNIIPSRAEAELLLALGPRLTWASGRRAEWRSGGWRGGRGRSRRGRRGEAWHILRGAATCRVQCFN